MLEEVSCNATVLELTWNSFENISSFQSSEMFSVQVFYIKQNNKLINNKNKVTISTTKCFPQRLASGTTKINIQFFLIYCY